MRITSQPVNYTEDCECCNYVVRIEEKLYAALKHEMNDKFNVLLTQIEELKKQNEELRAVKVPKESKFISNADLVKCETLCKENKLDELKVYIDKYCDVVSKNDSKLLCIAAEKGHTECVKLLINAGANIYAQNDYAICIAAHNGHLKCVEFLIKHHANVHAVSNFAIRYAAQNGHTECVKLLINAGANIHAENDFAIRYAAWGNHADVMEFLAENNADVRAKDSEIIKDLFLLNKIINADTKKIVKIYLKYGGPMAVNVVNKYLKRAIEESKSNLVDIFRECLDVNYH